jgi:hypothetical protein
MSERYNLFDFPHQPFRFMWMEIVSEVGSTNYTDDAAVDALAKKVSFAVAGAARRRGTARGAGSPTSSPSTCGNGSGPLPSGRSGTVRGPAGAPRRRHGPKPSAPIIASPYR